MITARYINPLIQFEKRTYDLVIEDDEGNIQETRISKIFSNNDTKSIYVNDANDTINDILTSLELPLLSEQIIPLIDLPEGVVLEE